ncbi:MAG: 30S ribosomal protein S6 [Candidatus Ancillula sp.]|jgi:small subunit ribosomal protein S6|nr:30S ribosomal protein S6 [Candidatus Ancillula sp.]
MSKPNTAGNVHGYEACIIFDGAMDEKKSVPLLEKYLDVIKSDGGNVAKVENWGRRKLAYEIDKKADGIYTIVNFECKSATSDEFARRIGLEERVLRYKIFRGDK